MTYESIARVRRHFTTILKASTSGALIWAAAATPTPVFAQTATVEGSLSAFDVVNDSGQDGHGFEIRIDGAQQGDLYYTMYGQRYGNAKIAEDPDGVSIRYESPYDAVSHKFTVTTPQHVPNSPFSWNDCYTAGSRYSVSGCEHFGQSVRNPANITKVTGYWLVEDSSNPGTLKRLLPPATIPFAAWTVAPPTTATPVVIAEVEAPDPPDAPDLFGDAQWVKVYVTQLTRQVSTDELSTDNPVVVPEDPSQIDIDWQLLQAEPPSGGNGNRNRGKTRNESGIDPETRSVIRRYELYKYTGAYDALTHEAVCLDGGLCNAPSAGELGEALSSQNTAANVTPDVLVVTRMGNGTVTGDNGINCGNTCAEFGLAGSAVTLTATPGSQVFTGWTGACSGTLLTCSTSVSGVTNVGARFDPLPTATVSVLVAGSGEVRASTGSIRCPNICSGVFALNTTVTFTAKEVKDRFTGWSGACTGTALTCTVTLTADTTLAANFAPPSSGGSGGGGTTATRFRLTTKLNGNGTVASNPTGSDFSAGTVVTLTATPKVGSPWVGWSGACTGSATTCSVTMNADKTVTANFR
ncbi:MAG: hypothetical protein HOP16_07715 [Acidobacteria bacterium]|nr:hypothetical protein [Acidobacteriota bacterium]